MNNYEDYEEDEERSTDEEIVLVRKKSNQVKMWQDLGEIKGYYIATSSVISYTHSFSSYSEYEGHRNVWATKEQAEASLAMSQLSQLMLRENEGWKPDWSDNSYKYCIAFFRNNITTYSNVHSPYFLAFKVESTRNKFLELHRDLIEKAKPLL